MKFLQEGRSGGEWDNFSVRQTIVLLGPKPIFVPKVQCYRTSGVPHEKRIPMGVKEIRWTDIKNGNNMLTNKTETACSCE